jgi:UDP-2,3-diacylglucosamine hydrolase
MKLGLIAGNGRFPFLVLDAARSMGYDVVVIAIREEASKDLEAAAAGPPPVPLHWLSVGQISACLQILTEAHVSHAVMAGQVKHTRIFTGLRPDAALFAVMKGLVARNTDSLIGAVVGLLRERGIELIDSTALLAPMLAGEGPLTDRMPTIEERKDLEFGYRMADAIAGLDIGQTIAVKHQAVVAVEAMEGTDEVIGRAGYLAGPGVTIVKVAKPKQDMRFDVPVVGLATIQAMRVAGAAVLSIDAGKTLVFEREDFLASANEAGIAVVGRATTSVPDHGNGEPSSQEGRRS